jgi:C1A family cysteine protease
LVAACFATRSLDDELRMWGDWKQTYGRSFSPSADVHYFNCFRRNLAEIDRKNADPKEQATFGVNHFAHLCAAEFKATMLPSHFQATNRTTIAALPTIAGQAVDWRAMGAVTPIKNQGMCGSCWSFGATGSIEGAWKLAGNQLVGLSEEELVECDMIAADGCSGAQNLIQSYQWVVQNGGIDTEADYPYTSGGGAVGPCNTQKTQNKIAHISSYINLQSNEAQMASWIATNGPAQIGVDALSWQMYSGGIMSNCNGQQLDHSVLAVGFDTTFSTPYWIVKNSWGTMWGENGYIRLAYGSNQCGLDLMPCAPKV